MIDEFIMAKRMKANSLYVRQTKRLFDLFLGLIMLLILVPLIVLIAVMIYVFLGRPVFFKQVRPGKKGIPFVLYKFRTMSGTAGGEQVIGDAERITVFGKLLRMSSLDELPELINVIKGNMSLVGPRPLLLKYLDLYTPEQARRHEVRPGITGLAQVSGRNAISWEDKFKLDINYVENCNLSLDVKILLRTLVKVFKSEGICADGHDSTFEFEGMSGMKNGKIKKVGHHE
jgi:sugar transferase EpsL